MSRTVGVIGGMGPAATLDFFAKLIAATPASTDQDHLRVLIDNNPKIPDRNAAIAGTGPSPAPVLAEMARGLERSGAEVLVMACNTAHVFAADIRAAVRVPFLSIIDESADELARRLPQGATVGVLGTNGCLDGGLYQTALAERGLRAVTLDADGRKRFMAAIYAIKAGDVGEDVRGEIRALAEQLVADGASAVLSACTELPLVLKASDLSVPLLDSTDVLVARTVAWAHSRPSEAVGPIAFVAKSQAALTQDDFGMTPLWAGYYAWEDIADIISLGFAEADVHSALAALDWEDGSVFPLPLTGVGMFSMRGEFHGIDIVTSGGSQLAGYLGCYGAGYRSITFFKDGVAVALGLVSDEARFTWSDPYKETVANAARLAAELGEPSLFPLKVTDRVTSATFDVVQPGG